MYHYEYNSENRINWKVEDEIDKFASRLNACIAILVGFLSIFVLIAMFL